MSCSKHLFTCAYQEISVDLITICSAGKLGHMIFFIIILFDVY